MYKVTADHPTFSRQDKIVSELELSSYIHELKLAGYENINSIKLEDFLTLKNQGFEFIRKLPNL